MDILEVKPIDKLKGKVNYLVKEIKKAKFIIA